MKKHLYIVAIIIMSFFISVPNSSAADKWTFDTAHSGFYFTINHIYSKVQGYFEDYSGEFRFNEDDLNSSSIEITIKTTSLNTNITKRDNHLRSKDFFEVSKYPYITFKSKKITHKGGNLYEVEGELTIKDVTKKITVPLKYFGTRTHPLQKEFLVAGFESRFSINRLEYNVGSGQFYRIGVAGKDVDIFVSIEMLRNR